MSVDQSQLSPQIRELIAQEIAKARAADQAANVPKELSPQEKVDAALAAVDAAASRERPGPANNDGVVSAIVTYLHAVADLQAADAQHDENQPAPSAAPASPANGSVSEVSASGDATAVEPTAAPAGD